MILNNPYYYHPQLAIVQAADDVFLHINSSPDIAKLFEQGKMLGVLIIENPSDTSNEEQPSRVHYLNNVTYLAAYSGVINGLTDTFFVPPIYDLQNPDDFYLQKDAEINAINARLEIINNDKNLVTRESTHVNNHIIKEENAEAKQLRNQRHELSIALQKEIFSHFNIVNAKCQYKNIIDIFADAKRGLPPGGTGECSAPRLLQYAYEHGLKPLALAEFWYGKSPKNIQRIHGHFYPSCIEKCSPILKYMIHEEEPEAFAPNNAESEGIRIIYEDDYLVVVSKPAGLLSVPAKDASQTNVETILHQMYPHVKGPMLVHRLDQATSGILVAAKDANTHKLMQQQFEQKSLQKSYSAILNGELKSSCGIISLPITVNPDDRPRQVVDMQYGKTAVTYYVNEGINKDGNTLLTLYPLTGRTHQLRVHCVSPMGLDHAILGDNLYDISRCDNNELDANNIKRNTRLMLHAEKITFKHPITNELLCIVDKAEWR